jgi:hypothetical protein
VYETENKITVVLTNSLMLRSSNVVWGCLGDASACYDGAESIENPKIKKHCKKNRKTTKCRAEQESEPLRVLKIRLKGERGEKVGIKEGGEDCMYAAADW